MSEAEPPSGRPGAGAVLAAQIADGAARRPGRRDLKPLSALWPFVRAHWPYAALGFVSLLLSTAGTLGLTGAGRLLVDHGFAKGSAEKLDRYFLIALGVAMVLALATASRAYFVNRLGERVVADLRRAVYARVLSLDQAYFSDVRTGEVLSRMTTDVTIVEGVAGASVSVALRNLLSLIGALALMLVVSPKLTGCVLLLVPFVLLPMFGLGRRVRRLSVQAQDRFADAVAYAGETLDQLETVQAFGRERAVAARFGAAVEAAFSASMSRLAARSTMIAIVILFVFGGVGAVLWLGSRDVIAGRMSGGQFFQFLVLSILAAGAVNSLGELWGEIQKASGAMERINALLLARPSIAAPAGPMLLPSPARGEVAFERVFFSYPSRPDLPALRGFDLRVRPGETVALVGPSGAGKSTVFRLLLRFYDPEAGRVTLDGVDLREADPAEVRARMALVAQDAALFSGTALDNIRFGREDASVDEARAAARAAEAEGFLVAMSGGLEHVVGERGRSLSGGQRQRLAIARALVRGAPVLLLDEATSALDAENERLVQKALNEAMSGRTTLVIAHRLATVLRADRIVVMEDGVVVEQGRHAELVARGGLYARLAELQFANAAELRARTASAAQHDVDLIIVGGGLSGGLTALKLAEARPELRTLILEAGPTLGGQHTWSFFETDVSPAALAWLKPLIAQRWPGYSVRFPKRKRRLATPYFSITAERFHATLSRKLTSGFVLNAEAAELRPDGVTLADGRSVDAPAVIDARGPAPSRHIELGFQKFLGLEVETERSHGLTAPVIMDADVAQLDGYRFVYTLPFGPRRLLIEDTRYADAPALDADALRTSTLAYAARQGWPVTQVVREEHGVLPVALGGDIYAFWAEAEREAPAARIGLGALLFHPTTGYSLPDAVRTAERIARMPVLTTASLRAEVRVASTEAWTDRAFFRALNRMLFRAAEPDRRFKILQRFYGLPEPLIRRFYAAELGFGDKLRILAGKPPVPIGAALKALPDRPVPIPAFR